MKADERIIKAKVALQRHQPFFAYLASYLKFEEAKWIATIGVSKDGWVVYCPSYIDKLSDEEVEGVLCHEIMHLVLDHLDRRGGRTARRWNVAADIVVNPIVEESGKEKNGYHTNFKMPAGSLKAEFFKIFRKIKPQGRSAEELYNLLPKDKGKGLTFIIGRQCKDKESFGDLGDTSGTGYSVDKHIHKNYKDGEGAGKGNKDGKAPKKGKSNVFGNSKRPTNWKKLAIEAAVYAKQQGHLPAGLEELIESRLQPQLPWKAILWNHILREIPFDYTFARPHRRSISLGIYLPSIEREMIDIIWSLDTSGSMDTRELQQGITEGMGVMQSFDNVRMTFLQCDAEMQASKEIRNVNQLKKLVVKGRGGTDFRPVFKWISKNKPQAKLLVFFTDGYGTYPRKEQVSVKTIWVLTKNSASRSDKAYYPPFGKVIKMSHSDDDED